MKVITSPNIHNRQPEDIVCFLAGGISNCPDWQKTVIEEIEKTEDIDLSHLVIFNPRQENFKMYDAVTAQKQIEWEFRWLEQCDIFSMYFCNADSVQPICMYELGRHVLKKERQPNNIIISIEDGYARQFDVITQVNLAITKPDVILCHATPRFHAARIVNCYKAFLD